MFFAYALWYDAYVLLSLGGALWTVLGTGISPFWGLLLWPAYLLGLCLVHVLAFCLVSFVLPSREPEHIRPTLGRFFLHQTVLILLKLMRVRVHIRGREHLRAVRHKPVLMVSNHLSHFDPFVECAPFFWHGIIFVSKPENLTMPLMGSHATRAGFIGIDRVEPMKAMRAIRRAGQRLAEDRAIVGVYPEGTISRDGVLKGFHEGTFLAATHSGADILVTTVRNTEKIKKNWYKLGTDVYLTFEGVIPAEEIAEARVGDVAARARDMMLPTLRAAGMEAPDTGTVPPPDLTARHTEMHEGDKVRHPEAEAEAPAHV